MSAARMAVDVERRTNAGEGIDQAWDRDSERHRGGHHPWVYGLRRESECVHASRACKGSEDGRAGEAAHMPANLVIDGKLREFKGDEPQVNTDRHGPRFPNLCARDDDDPVRKVREGKGSEGHGDDSDTYGRAGLSAERSCRASGAAHLAGLLRMRELNYIEVSH